MFFKETPKFQWMRYRRVALCLSGILILGSLLLLVTRGLNLGIDFTGGVLLQLEFPQATKAETVRAAMSDIGQKSATIQSYTDKEYMVRFAASDEQTRRAVISALEKRFPGMKVSRYEKVGPVVGKQLQQQALIALVLATGGILLYLTFRFQFRFATVSVIALLHDAIIIIGAFALTRREVSVDFIAAILTILGYSVNDTIVVLDRVRENWGHVQEKGILQVLDDSMNQTLSRTINTSLTIFLAVLSLYLLGGPIISNFAFAFVIGTIVGTYSSIYVASALLGEWYLKSPQLQLRR